MALKEALAVKQVVGNTLLELTADAGESLLVTGIYIDTPAASYVTLQTDKTSVGYFRVGGTQGNHLFFPDTTYHVPNLLDLLRERNLFAGYPVPEGSTFRMTGVKQATSFQAVTYSIFDAGDIKADDVNGPEAKLYQYAAYGRADSVLADGDEALNTPQTPAEFPDFPYGEVAPQGKQVTLHVLAMSDIGYATATAANIQNTSYLKLIKEREVLFDEDRNGLLLSGTVRVADGTDVGTGVSVLGNRSDADLSDPLILGDPLVFHGGEELNAYITSEVTAGSAILLALDCELMLWLAVQPE